MNELNGRHSVPSPDDDLLRLWQHDPTSAADAERAARMVMARVWRFDHQIFWRNFREYAVGLVLMVIFAGQLAIGDDRIGGAIGLVCVGFVLGYLWWKHRGLEPLDPSADVSAYRQALVKRLDDQIRLLRSVPYWYLLPLFLPGLWVAISRWHRIGWMALPSLAVLVVVYVLIGWLNVKVAAGGLRTTRDRVATMGSEAEG